MECDRRDLLRAGLAAGAWAAGCSSASPPAADEPRTTQDASEPRPLRTLDEWIAHDQTLSPVYRGGLANHLPMALYAMSALGATPQQIDAFATRYSQLLVPLEPGTHSFGEREWRTHLGDFGALAALVRGFDAWIARDGAESVLRATLPTLMPGLAAAGWHGMIRVAYGWRFGNAHEVAHGLAYWTAWYVELGALRPLAHATFATPMEQFLAARATPALACKPGRGGVVGRMQSATHLAGFDAIGSALRVDERTLAEMGRASALVFATSCDFTALHACTGTQALRVLLPLCADRELALRYHGQSLVAAYVGIGTPGICTPTGTPPSWDELSKEACTRLDDHDVKLTDALREEERTHGEGAWRAAVAARLGQTAAVASISTSAPSSSSAATCTSDIAG